MSKKKKSYAVTLPVAGSITVYVEASTEEEAVDLAFEKQDWRVETGEGTEAGEEWVSLKHLVRGNTCSVPVWEMTVDCEDE